MTSKQPKQIIDLEAKTSDGPGASEFLGKAPSKKQKPALLQEYSAFFMRKMPVRKGNLLVWLRRAVGYCCYLCSVVDPVDWMACKLCNNWLCGACFPSKQSRSEPFYSLVCEEIVN